MTPRYEQRAAAHAARRDAETRRSVVIARLRLAAFLPGAGLVVWSLARGIPAVPMAVGLALLLVFAVLVVWHARVDERAEWADARREVNLHALARIARAWDRLPAAGPPRAASRDPHFAEHHPYAMDLDLFGRASLMQWLGPAATAAGTNTLERWLLHPAASEEVYARQVGVRELAPAIDWREELGAHGRLAAGVRPAELDRFLEWAEGPRGFAPSTVTRLRAVVLALTAAIWLLIALHAAGFTPGAFWLVPVTAGMILSFATAAQVHGQFNRAGAGQHALARYSGLFAHAAAAPAATPHLQGIHARLGASGASAAACMARLNRILGFAQFRVNPIVHFVAQSLTLWDFHVFFALDRWHREVGGRVRGWMDAVGELDALSAFAQVSADNPAWAMPELSAAARTFSARDLGHPLIPDDRRVGNEVAVGPPGTLLLITGSNMSGKSTLLRAIGLNTVLAQAGGPVCASALEMPLVDLETSIRVQDSLEQGLSYFMAALARLKGLVDRSHRRAAAMSEDPRLVMYLLDEILQGTNTAERAIAVRGVARHLLRAGAIGVMTTHDLSLADQEPLDTAARLVHFTEIVDAGGRMTFDYRLRPGLATSRNALRLMELIGIDLDLDAGVSRQV